MSLVLSFISIVIISKVIVSKVIVSKVIISIEVPYFIMYSAHTSIVRTVILQFYPNTLFMNKVGECYLPSKVHRQYFSIIFNGKKLHTILDNIW